MREKILNFTKKPFIRNIIILTSGTVVAQIIGMLLSPVITRLYGPESFGLMGSFAAITAIIAPIAALTMPIAIVLPKKEVEAKGLAKLSIALTAIISLLAALLLPFFKDYIVNTFNLNEIAPYLNLIPIVLLFAGIFQVIEQWLIRTNQFGISAKGSVWQAVIVNGGKVGFGLINPTASILILFTAFREGIRSILLLLASKNFNLVKFFSELIKIKFPFKKLMVKYRDFPLFRAPQTFINSISQSIPILMLASFFGPTSVGFYNIGRLVLNMPTQLIGKSVGDVYYPRISKIANDKSSVTNFLIKATLVLFGIAIFPFGAVIITGPQLFSLVFGSDWVLAGEYARWLALWSFSSFILHPTVRTLPVLYAQRFHLVYTFGSLLIRLSMLAIGYFVFANDIIAIALFGISSGLLNIVLILITIYLSKKFDEKNE